MTPANRFCYLGSYLSNTISVDTYINSRLAKAGDAFGKLQRRLWGEHSVALLTKIAVYQAVVLSTLLYGCESWVLYRRSVRRLDEFHMRCLHKVAGIKWQDRVPNTEVLRICGSSGTEAFLLAAQLCWVGHVVRMEDDRIPKQVFFGQLSSGKRPQCGPVSQVKTNMKRCGLQPKSPSTTPFDRAQWRTTCQSATASFEMSRVAELDRKRSNGQLASSRSSTPRARFGRATDAAGPAHHGLGSSPIGVPVGDAIHRIRRCTPCVGNNREPYKKDEPTEVLFGPKEPHIR